MKIIKILITITLINAALVIGIVKFGGATRNVVIEPSTIPSISPIPSASPVATLKPVALVNPSKAPMATTTPTATPSPTQTPTVKQSGCVIQIDGVKYEITSLVRTHSGGNVFTCGTDMSAIFWSRHNARILQMMGQYKI